MKINDLMLLNRQLPQTWTKYDKLASLIEESFQKLNYSLDMLLSTQKEMSKLAGILDSNKPLDFELEFDCRPHPFKTFEMLEFPMLTITERTIYNLCLIESKNDSALAFYLYKNSDLSRSSKAAAKSCFLKFI